MNYLRWVLLSTLTISTSLQAAAPKIAVTDLAYKEQLSGYFRYVNYKHKSSEKAKYQGQANASPWHYSAKEQAAYQAKSQTEYTEIEHRYNYVQYTELRKFVGDIKGEILKKGSFRLSQAKPYTKKGSEKIFDIIGRIKKGYYPNADYVLFGTVSELEFRNETQPISGTNTTSNIFNLMLVADFSLINTKTYEVKAGFSAIGEGQDMRIMTGSNHVMPSRARVISQVSKSLGEDVAEQIYEQVNGYSNDSYNEHSYSESNSSLKEGSTIYFSK